MSWFNPREDMPVVRILNDVTEPILSPIRRVVPKIGMLDLTPLVAIMLLGLVQRVVTSVILGAS